jgi:hypothetical protein
MYRLSATLALSVVASCGILLSQTNAPTHNHPAASVIDGAAHPDLIPDLTAYRLWFAAVSRPPAPTDEQIKSQHMQLAKIGLRDPDEKTLVSILADFSAQYHALIQNYNAEATAEIARGESPDLAALRLQRDLLVQSTHDRIKMTLAPGSWALVDSHVQNEKKRMKISLEGGQQ